MDDSRRATFGPRLTAASILVGLVAGLAGAAVTLFLHLVQHLSFGYTENTFLVGVEQASSLRRVLAVGIGGLVVGLGWWAYHRRVHTPASVTGALRGEHGLPLAPTTADALLQVIAVGAGASLGREGAPRQVGAALAGWIAARLDLSARQQRTLLACGAGAGLAAVYNVPFGGAMFTLEALLASAALTDIVPAVITAGIATVTAWPFLGDSATYHPPAQPLTASLIVFAVVLGPIAGLFGVGFARIMTVARTHAPTGPRAAVAIAVIFTGLGALAIAYPELLGNGKSMAQLAFTGTVGAGTAAVLALLKPTVTAACLGAGTIGGLLTPSLATGSVLGVALGSVWTHAWHGAGPVGYALVGAAALLASAQHAPLTALVLLFDFTHCSAVIAIPATIAVLGATLVRKQLPRSAAT